MAEIFDSNSFLREFISKSTETVPDKCSFLKNMKEALIINNKKNEFIRMTLLPLLLIDSYKILSFRIKNGLSTEGEIQMFTCYEEIEDVQTQLKELYLKREDYLDYSIGTVSTFHNTPFLGKTLMLKGLNEYENDRLSSFSEFHGNDIKYYNIPITEEFIYKYYLEKSKKYTEAGVVFSPLTIIGEIAGIIHNNYVNEPEEMYGIIESINSQAFGNIDKLKEVLEVDYRYIDELKGDYEQSVEDFNDYSIYNSSVLEETIGLYFKMKELGIIKSKKLVNERHE